ncbi:hypothetical protein L6R52_19055, partial [Myxococcota bacterium]|nr:hypothetical protein [Myxococcota bacterium]
SAPATVVSAASDEPAPVSAGSAAVSPASAPVRAAKVSEARSLDRDDEDESSGPTVVMPEGLEGELLAQIFAKGVPLPELKKRLQEQAIARALLMTKGNITRAAEVLGMRRPRLSQIINASDELKGLCQGGER